jgi:hypothetical protein
MSEWLGKPRLERKDLPTHFRNLSLYSKYYEESQMARVCLVIPRDILDRFQQAVVERYGTFSAGNVKRVTEEALRMWIESVEKQR